MKLSEMTTPKQRDNLRKLAELLKSRELNFEMESFIDSKTDEREYAIQKPSDYQNEERICNTVACAVGWGPLVVPVPDAAMNQWSINYSKYAEIAFGARPMDKDRIFDALFSGRWSNLDNTRLGAAFRIETVLELDAIPDCFDPWEMEDNEYDEAYLEYTAMYKEWEAKNA